MTHMPRGRGRPPSPIKGPEIPAQPKPRPDLTWYIAVSKPGHGIVELLDRLHDAKYAAWCPLGLRKRLHARQTRLVLVPLFGQYLFVGVKPGQGVAPIRDVAGIFDFCRSDAKQPQTIEPRVLAVLWESIQAKGGAIPFEEVTRSPWDGIKEGDDLFINDGPLMGHPAVFCGWDKDQIKISVALLGRPMVILMPPNQVIRAG